MPKMPSTYKAGSNCKAKPPSLFRRNANARGYTYAWQRAAAKFLRLNPLCRRCLDEGSLMAAQVVDHRVPHRGNPDLFWDEDNWQPLCKACHDHKTLVEKS
jgi:5-methylcytosine-specific restriction protein A